MCQKQEEVCCCFQSADIYLPSSEVDKFKWSVIACDQFTSESEYWYKVEKNVSDAPSTLNLILPEVYLEENSSRVAKIQKNMMDYLENKILEKAVDNGYVLVERDTDTGKRLGLVGKIDLEQYAFLPEDSCNAQIRATEKTVIERIPARIEIRKNAMLELPHVMLLFDDSKYEVLKKIYEKKEELHLLYDTDLMLDGGHVKGYAIEDEDKKDLDAMFGKMQKENNNFMFVVGDGNHSLATAKNYWDELKSSLSVCEREKNPARYALVEIVDLYSEMVVFKPIYRLLYDVDFQKVLEYVQRKLNSEGFQLISGDEITFIQKDKQFAFSIENAKERLPLEIIQNILDDFLREHVDASIDYIHGEKSLRDLIAKTGGCGIMLQPVEKENLFAAVKAGGVLPRKTFSIGEANEKRYYMECRKLKDT